VPQRHGADPLFPDGEWMLSQRVAVFDNFAHRLRVWASVRVPEYGSLASAYHAALEQAEALAEALRKPLPPQTAFAPLGKLEDGWERAGFEAAVTRAREYIAAGDCMQVVLSRRLTAEYSGAPFDLYRALRKVSPTPYLFFLRFAERALAGASPELLIRLQADTVTVRPIAGTRPRGATEGVDAQLEAELRADPKERAEHVMLVDLGRNDVGRVSRPGSVRVEEREVVERYSHVMHLVSQVSGKLTVHRDAFDVLAAAFPAGTVSGAPKVRALQIIDELEPCSRGPYSGAAGYVGFDGDMDLAIAIRSVALSGTTLRLQAGAGIVHDSQPQAEYQETAHKLRAALVALAADGGEG
jgi:anthranilate synthase component 1